jgi:hypothetical protein
VAERIKLKQTLQNSENVDRMNDTSNEYGNLAKKPLVKWQLKKTDHPEWRSTKLVHILSDGGL